MPVIYSMRRFVQAALFLIPLAAAANPLYIEGLMNQKNKYPASAALKGFMANEEKETLKFCLEDPERKLGRAENFFAAKRIPLGQPAGVAIYMVFPTQYCPMYFGASSMPYWLVKEMPDKQFSVLHSGTTHVVHLLPEKSHGLNAIMEQYGSTEKTYFYFDGVKFRLR
ncbi:hypothetical protein [Polaromonas sp. LjRoot131]|uniref:hypothetical protein n=1 Tax=Polaromonas sp. LjRoot131 TaxID=3342262 RepID=UPI003ECF2777